jgi:vancomycin resistance protein VanJ
MPALPVLAAALRLLTYNVNYANSDPKASLDAIADADADVVLLQEVDAAWQQRLAKRFGKQYPHQIYRPHTRAPGGLAVLSKREITREELLPSPNWFPAERLVIDGVQILNVHLRPQVDGGSWIKGYFTTRSIRRKEIEAYWPKLAHDLPTIVAGDFNEAPEGRAVAFLRDHGLARVPTKGPHTWHIEPLEMDIDHVMIDGALAARDGKVLDAGSSDHRPVIVTIEPR